MASLWIRSGCDMKVDPSVETYQVGVHFKALIKAILVALSRILENFFSFHVSLSPCVFNSLGSYFLFLLEVRCVVLPWRPQQAKSRPDPDQQCKIGKLNAVCNNGESVFIDWSSQRKTSLWRHMLWKPWKLFVSGVLFKVRQALAKRVHSGRCEVVKMSDFFPHSENTAI